MCKAFNNSYSYMNYNSSDNMAIIDCINMLTIVFFFLQNSLMLNMNTTQHLEYHQFFLLLSLILSQFVLLYVYV